jgi:hypothetical protein
MISYSTSQTISIKYHDIIFQQPNNHYKISWYHIPETNKTLWNMISWYFIEIVWLVEYDIMIFYRDCLAAGIWYHDILERLFGCWNMISWYFIEIVWLLEYDIMIFYRDCLAAGSYSSSQTISLKYHDIIFQQPNNLYKISWYHIPAAKQSL